ncbi:MAG: SIS domain-containing protein [FCB group bacterium]|nr:SIS domain-containing protein [FCB group bacterium]
MRAMIKHCQEDLDNAAAIMIAAVQGGKKILWCGNGGSAAQAQHLSTELVGGLRDHNRPAIPSLALTTDSSLLTAWTNDTAFETIFSRQIEALGEPGDVLVAISTSGNSGNVIAAARTAREKQMPVVALTGRSGGALAALGKVAIRIPSDDTQRIQEGHILSGHILCELIEQAVVKSS